MVRSLDSADKPRNVGSSLLEQTPAIPVEPKKTTSPLHAPKLWHIAGIGALGQLFACHFLKAGLPVQLILKNEAQLTCYHKTGLTVHQGDQTWTGHPPAMTADDDDHQPIHYLISCVKAPDVLPLLTQLKHRLTPQSLLILIHNGLGVLEDIRETLPMLRVISGISTAGAYVEKPFTSIACTTGTLYLGQTLGTFTSKEIQTLCTSFQRTKLNYLWEATIYPRIWEKFAVNCSINLLTAVLDCQNGELLAHQALLKQLTNEITAILNAHHMQLPTPNLFLLVCQVLQNTASNYSSMHQDIQHKKPTELNYLNAYLLKLAKAKNIDAPMSQSLLARVINITSHSI